MNKIFLHTLTLALCGLFLVSCSDNENDFDPFSQQTKGEFFPTDVTFRKSSNSLDITESWTDIVRDKHNKVIRYDYTREVKGEITEKEKMSCAIDYYTDHEGQSVIRTISDVEFYKTQKGIEERYTQKVQENVKLNSYGYIESIATTIDHFEGNATTPKTSTSKRTFTYNGDFCTGSLYKDDNTQVTYKYNWSAYQLTGITVLRENFKNNTVDYNTYKYTFDKKEFYKYSGTEILPFVQSGFPQIFASMGYLGKCTPYILTDEVQGGYTKFGNVTSENPEVKNSYNFNGDINTKMMYSGISNIYNSYSITFSK